MDPKFMNEISKAFHGAAGYASSAVSSLGSIAKKGVKKVVGAVGKQVDSFISKDKAMQDYKRDKNIKIMLKNGMDPRKMMKK